MLKKIIVLIILISSTIQSQNHIKGTLIPAQNYSWVVLYQLKGAKQLYIKNVTIKNGEFSIDFPQNAPKGMYRIMYSQKNGGFVDFIYNNENIEVKFDPTNPLLTLDFLISNENKIYLEYERKSVTKQQKLDSLQLSFFKATTKNQKENLNKLYIKAFDLYTKNQHYFDSISNGKLANHFIKSSFKYDASAIIKTPQEYLNSEKQHYFDYVNFKDKELLNSIFLSEKVSDYVFYLNRSEDTQVQNSLYKNSILEVLKKVGDNTSFKSELLVTLMYNFAQLENTVLLDYLLENFYKKLPSKFINEATINEIQEKVRLAVGKKAPDFSFEEHGKTIKLSDFNIADKYIIVFWSTECSHCLKEIPKLYKFTKDKKNVHVVGFTLENDDLGFKHYAPMYPEWTNILGLKKWQNPMVKKYQITATPTYFILDKNKRIIAKPELFEDVKTYFEENPVQN